MSNIPGKVVVVGGGTGITSVLRGLKDHADQLTAIVTVGDDGGSSGRLRKDYRMPPPGDIRNCLVAMSGGDPLLRQLLDYRFEDVILKGHSFGNLLLAVLTQLKGDFRDAIRWAESFLQVGGHVIPSTDCRVVLVAFHPDGTRTTGESRISRASKSIVGMELMPKPPPVSPEIQAVIAQADLVVLGPGSLYTSIIPNLLVPGMADAITNCPGRVVLVSNLMTQPGETDHLGLMEHVAAIRGVGHMERLDALFVDTADVDPSVRQRYAEAGAELLTRPGCAPEHIFGVPVLGAPLATLTPGGHWRHHPEALGEALCDFLRSRSRS